MPTVKRGSLTEIMFIHEAIKHDFVVFRPFVEQSEVDFIISKDLKILFRVQVKTAFRVTETFFKCDARIRSRPINLPDLSIIDYFSFYLPVRNVFFNVPTLSMPLSASFTLGYRHRLNSKYFYYQDNWDFIK